MLKWFKRDKKKKKDEQEQTPEVSTSEEILEETSEAEEEVEITEDERQTEEPDETAEDVSEGQGEFDEESDFESEKSEIEEAEEDVETEELIEEDAEIEDEAQEETEAEDDIEAESENELGDESEPAKKKSFFARLKERLANTRAILNTRVDHLLLGVREIDADILEELEEILITSDLGVRTTQDLMKTISEKVARKELTSADKLKQVLRDEIGSIVSLPPTTFADNKPHVIMVVGVNGVGKTTTIAKLAHRYHNEGKKVMLVAGDTFRAAAVEQLTIWSERVGVEIVKQKTGSDPSAVVFDALHAAQARDVDVVIIDTAGRLHTKVNLMEELKKINRVAGREMPGAPHEVLLVLDATTGQNAVNQAKQFNEAVQVNQIAMTKLDGTAKGGVLIAICHDLKIPIRYIGLGEHMEDLRDFDPKAYVEALFG